MTSTAAINQKEYLKRYLSKGRKDGKKKRKKTKISTTGCGLNIVDDNLETVTIEEDDDADLYELAENAPQVAGVFDDRPIHIQQAQDKLFGAKWRALEADEEIQKTVPDQSSARKNRGTDSDLSPKRVTKEKSSDDDVSPPRKTSKRDKSPSRKENASRRRSSSPMSGRLDSRGKERRNFREKRSASPKSRRRLSSDSESSGNERRRPPPQRQNRSRSPKRVKGRRGDSSQRSRKMSPAGRKRRSSSPRRRERLNRPSRFHKDRDSDSDISPPRETGQRNKLRDKRTKSHSPQRRQSDSSSRAPRNERSSKEPRRRSPVAKTSSRRCQNSSDSDLSPPRHSKVSKKADTLPRQRPMDSDSDLSPPRVKKEPLSPSERSRQTSKPPSVVIKQEPVDSQNARNKTLEGKTAGLQDAKTLKAEMELYRKKEQEQYKKLSDQVSGRGAQAVFRDRRTGRKRNLEQEEEESEIEKEAERKRKEEFDRIGRGVVQEEKRAQALQETLHEMSKPVARYAGDEDLERHLKAQERDGDPMLDYLRAKRIKENPGENKPAYKGPDGPPNRFNIVPGHRWDGVDRSNGYEKKLFISRNAKEAQQEEAYKWSVADM
ncbi:BUD13 homolog isoform X1 [Neocloeon triangulifer]|uniref:BUD13 homolog isoform X1 n=1 Tax=Neocloeon triangulifer TaxID=2078957 RepID=UPI00286F0529|nr:BUD13 homolog isoform X1 [Neocloeon triangulifer]